MSKSQGTETCACMVDLEILQLLFFNPFTDKQLTLFCTVPKLIYRFRLLSVFCLRCGTISRRAARRLIVLHPSKSMESELKWQTCPGMMSTKFSWSSVKGLMLKFWKSSCSCSLYEILILFLCKLYDWNLRRRTFYINLFNICMLHSIE